MQIKRVGVFSVGKVFGALYGLMGLIFGVIFSCISLLGSAAAFSSEVGNNGAFGLIFGVGSIIFLPLFYGIAGFIVGIIMAALYNLIAGWIGGIEIYTE